MEGGCQEERGGKRTLRGAGVAAGGRWRVRDFQEQTRAGEGGVMQKGRGWGSRLCRMEKKGFRKGGEENGGGGDRMKERTQKEEAEGREERSQEE